MILPNLDKELHTGAETNKKFSPGWINLMDGKEKKLRPVIRCNCGEIVNLKKHHIFPSGEVRGSFLHMSFLTGGCGWHQTIELADYHGQEFLPEG